MSDDNPHSTNGSSGKSWLDKLKLKMGKNYDIGAGKGSTFVLELDKKFEDKVLEMLINNRINVQGA